MSELDIGLIGLGTMGAMLALNIADYGFGVAVFNRTTSRTRDFIDTAGPLAEKLTGCDTLEDLVAERTADLLADAFLEFVQVSEMGNLQ